MIQEIRFLANSFTDKIINNVGRNEKGKGERKWDGRNEHRNEHWLMFLLGADLRDSDSAELEWGPEMCLKTSLGDSARGRDSPASSEGASRERGC